MSGIYNLGDSTISTAVSNSVITESVSISGGDQHFIDGLDWMAAVTLFANFIYGAGGTTCVVVVQTSLDGTNWIDIARFDFSTSSQSKRCNLSGLTPVGAAAVTTLSSDSVMDGILGDRLRTRITTTGTYTGNTAISVRAAVR